MTKLIVFTDLHMVPEGRRVFGIDPFARLQAGVRHANAIHPDAAQVIITGDLTHEGDVASYRRVGQVLGELTIPYQLMIGNHDRRDAFLDSFPAAPRDGRGFVQQALDVGACRLILLDTALRPPSVANHAGELGAERLAWLDAELAAARDKPVIVFMHHPPHATGFPGMDRIGLHDGDDFFRHIARHGNVRHIVAGHVHRTVSGSFRGIPFSIFKSPVHQQPMDLRSLDSSLSVDEPAAYGILLLGPESVIVHTEDYEIASRSTPQREPRSR